MTEEEKAEFKHIKKRAEFVTKNILGTNVFTTYDVHCVNKLIAIIEEQQKELEQEKEKNKDHTENKELVNQVLGLPKNTGINQTLHEIIVLNNFVSKEKEKNKTKVDIKDIEFSDFIKENYIHKNKIKEKIEEVSARTGKDCNALHDFQREAEIDVLKELLEVK